MDLPHIFASAQSGKVSRNVFFALDIGQEVVTAGLWEADSSKVLMKKTSSPIEWEGENPNDIIEASDVAIEELGVESNSVNTVMFGLPDTWAPEGGIAEDKKKILKELCEKLMLTPVGYVVTTEALNKFLCEQEGGPLHAIFVEFATQFLTITLVQAGKIQQTEHVGRSTDTAADLLEGFARFKSHQLPLQILLYSARMKQEELEHEKQVLLNYDWQKTKEFLHIPTVNVLAQKIMIEAVCIAGGAAIAQSLGIGDLQTEGEKKTGEQKKDEGVRAPVIKEMGVAVSSEVQEGEFGFEEVIESQEQEVQQENTPPEVLEQESPTQQPTRKLTLPKITIPKLPKLRIRIPHINIKMRLGVVVILVAIVFLFGAGFTVYAKTQSKANILVILKTTQINKDAQISLSPSEETNEQTMTVKAQEITKEVSGEKTGQATGAKTIGDKASGKVTLFNASSGVKNFPAGTLLTGPNNLKFTLDSDVSIASSSGSASSIQPGKTDVNVTAQNIGADSNVGANTEFTVANFDKMTYVAKNEQPFSGGSSREVQVVSKEDRILLEQQLIAQLKQQALEELKQEQVMGTQLVVLDSGEVSEQKFSAEVGREAQTLTLSMTYVAKALKYSPEDLTPLAKSLLTPLLPEHTVLQDDKSSFSVTSTRVATGSSQVVVEGVLSSYAIPTVDTQNLKLMLAGKTLAQARAVLADQKEITSATVTITPPLVQAIFNTLPSSVDRIMLETRVE